MYKKNSFSYSHIRYNIKFIILLKLHPYLLSSLLEVIKLYINVMYEYITYIHTHKTK